MPQLLAISFALFESTFIGESVDLFKLKLSPDADSNKWRMYLKLERYSSLPSTNIKMSFANNIWDNLLLN